MLKYKIIPNQSLAFVLNISTKKMHQRRELRT